MVIMTVFAYNMTILLSVREAVANRKFIYNRSLINRLKEQQIFSHLSGIMLNVERTIVRQIGFSKEVQYEVLCTGVCNEQY